MDGIRTPEGVSTATKRQGADPNAITRFLSERQNRAEGFERSF